MTAAAVETAVPRVWIGCLHCYNSGHLVGDWFDAVGADEVSLADVHRGSGRGWTACEELWCLDHEHIPISGEFGPLEAAQWGEAYTQVGAERWPAVCAWIRSGMHVVEGTGDIPSLPDFEERYCGQWDSFREYAEELAEETGMMVGWPDEATRHFNWSSWVNDLRHDYTTMDAPAPDYGVFIFRNL